SRDGHAWHKVATVEFSDKIGEPQLKKIQPAEAQYVRLTTIEPGDYTSSIPSLLAYGNEIKPLATASLDGCWEINGQPARFIVEKDHVSGVLGDERPIYIEGGLGTRAARLTWVRSPMWGYATITLTPDGSRLTGLTWHEEVNTKYGGEAWFGTRTTCKGGTLDALSTVTSIMSRSRRWSL